MRSVVATALVLLLALFIGPILFLRGEAPGPPPAGTGSGR